MEKLLLFAFLLGVFGAANQEQDRNLLEPTSFLQTSGDDSGREEPKQDVCYKWETQLFVSEFKDQTSTNKQDHNDTTTSSFLASSPTTLSDTFRLPPISLAGRGGHIAWLDNQEENLYVFGGCEKASTFPCFTDIYRFNFQAASWTKDSLVGDFDADDVELQMFGEAFVVDPEAVATYVFGGTRATMSDAVPAKFIFSNNLNVLQPSTKSCGQQGSPCHFTWLQKKTVGSTQPPPCQDAALALVNTTLVLFGGFSDVEYFQTVYTLETKAASWSWKEIIFAENQPKPTARKGHTFTSIGDQIFLFGGSDGDSSLQDLWILTREVQSDKEIWQWEKWTPSSGGLHGPPNARAFHTATAVDDKLFIFGGCDYPNSVCYNDLHILDITQQEWLAPPSSISLLSSAPASKRRPRARQRHTTTFSYSAFKLYVFGGYSLDSSFSDINSLNLDAVCKNSCGSHGMYDPETESCICNGDYSGKFCSDHASCPNNCSGSNHGSCAVKNDIHYCECVAGFWGLDCSYPLCPSNCTGRGICRESKLKATCECFEGWSGEDCSISDERPYPVTVITCPSYCSAHGICELDKNRKPGLTVFAQEHNSTDFHERVCKCAFGFSGPICTQQCPLGCSGPTHGRCLDSGMCECFPGWKGLGCSIPHCGNNCSNHGVCVNNQCLCKSPYIGGECQQDSLCSGRGSMVDGSCFCQEPFLPPDCASKLECSHNCRNGKCKPSVLTPSPPPVPPASLAFASAFSTLREASHRVKFQHAVPEPEFPAQLRYNDKVRYILDTALNSSNVVTRQGECQCESGYTGPACDQVTCANNCNDHGTCNSRNGVCECFPGYAKPDCAKVLESCPGNCSSGVHGACQPDGTCLCRTPYIEPDCLRMSCPNGCSGSGECVNGLCQCLPGFSGTDCSKHCLGNCSGHGLCVNGVCSCDAGYTPPSCQEENRCPIQKGKECNGHGICFRAAPRCICEPGWSGDDCSQGTTPSNVTNSEGYVCNGRGQYANGLCFCDIGYEGPTCSIASKCPNDCNGRGFCHLGACLCCTPFSGDSCEQGTEDVSCLDHCNGNGVCQYGKCHCLDGYDGDKCQDTVGFCQNNTCSDKGVCRFNKCFCIDGATGLNCESAGCSSDCLESRGVCLQGKCHCLPGWSGENCQHELTCPGGPGLNACSGHGVCYNGLCACLPGYAGQDCSILYGRSSNGPCDRRNCSNNGVCVNGDCFCLNGHTGKDCSIALEGKCPNDCSEHGTCHYGHCFCEQGYDGVACEIEKTCSSKCLENGVCVHGACLCCAGYIGKDCDQPLPATPESVYEQEMASGLDENDRGCGHLNSCSFHGVCVEGKCACEAGYSGYDCAIVKQGLLSARCPNGCNGEGTCLFGKCFCHPGFTGRSCDRVVECPDECNHNGQCIYGRCLCDPGFRGSSCDKVVKEVCAGGCRSGVCLNHRCLCPDGVEGTNCEIENETSTVTKLTELKSRSIPDVMEQTQTDLEKFSRPEGKILMEENISSKSVGQCSNSFTLLSLQTLLIFFAFLTGIVVTSLSAQCWQKRKEKFKRNQMLKPLIQP